MFDDRTDAGRRLGDALRERGVEADVVLAIPRGGLPLGRAVADALGADLDVIVASKIGAPHNPELALGAVAGDGSAWLNDDLIDRFEIDDGYLESEREREAAAAREKVERYRGGDPAPDLQGEATVLVDDGIATGATAVACLRQLRAAGARRIVLAVPVAPPDAIERVRAETDVDEIVCLETPEAFGAVGRHYRSFPQITDEEALEYLAPR